MTLEGIEPDTEIVASELRNNFEYLSSKIDTQSIQISGIDGKFDLSSGHIHNATAGNGPRISHADLTDLGGDSHTIYLVTDGTRHGTALTIDGLITSRTLVLTPGSGIGTAPILQVNDNAGDPAMTVKQTGAIDLKTGGGILINGTDMRSNDDPLDIGIASLEGTSPYVSRKDHVHVIDPALYTNISFLTFCWDTLDATTDARVICVPSSITTYGDVSLKIIHVQGYAGNVTSGTENVVVNVWRDATNATSPFTEDIATLTFTKGNADFVPTPVSVSKVVSTGEFIVVVPSLVGTSVATNVTVTLTIKTQHNNA